MILLAIASFWFVVSWNPFNFSGWYFMFSGNHSGLTFFSIGWILAALLAAFLYYQKKKDVSRESLIRNFIRNGFYLDVIYQKILVRLVEIGSHIMAWTDKHIVDGIIHMVGYGQIMIAHVVAWVDKIFVDGSVNGAARMAGGIGSITRSFQGGKIQYYVFWALLGMVSLLFFLLS
jgi:NADH-quinone oxidoreductase subunit L